MRTRGGYEEIGPQKCVAERLGRFGQNPLTLCLRTCSSAANNALTTKQRWKRFLLACVFMHINLYELVLCSANFFAPCVADIISFQNTTHKILGKIYWIIRVNYLKLEILLNHWWFHSFWVSISRHLRRLRFASLAICTKLQAACVRNLRARTRGYYA